MRTLSIVVAVFGVAALAAYAETMQASALLLGVGALVCALTTYLSRTISTFLKIFVAIFATEVVVFGLVFLLTLSPMWPAALEPFRLPDSLPLTVAVFGILVFAVSHFDVVRKIGRIADRYFDNHTPTQARLWPLPAFAVRENRLAIAMVVLLVLINQAQVAVSVRLSFFSRDWFNAIQDKDQPHFWSLLFTVFAPWAVVYIASEVIEFVVQSMLTIRWRKWLTQDYVGRWLDGPTHYRMSLRASQTDNPDQRIAEDVNRFIDGGNLGYGVYSFSILLISTLSSLVSFAIILWTLSSDFTIPGTNIAVPGFLFWVALIYSALGTLITHLIGQSLVPLYFNRQRYEADFRFSLARLREYSEQVALLKGEAAERANVMGFFGSIYANYLRIVNRRKRLMAFTSAYGQISPFIPYIVAAPFYFAGKIQLGVMSQTAGAFARVESALTFFVNYYIFLADFKAVLDRLTTFDQSIAHAHDLARDAKLSTVASPDGKLALSHVTLDLPDGRVVVADADLAFTPGQSTLLTGASGTGKSTIFRAFASIWPFGFGEVLAPLGSRVMLLPQKPYIPIGSLRAATLYPGHEGDVSDAAIKAALVDARLGDFVDRLDDVDNWSQRLSGGEQQRLAIARALLLKPDWLFLDEATASLDEAIEEALYGSLAKRLPKTTIVSIGHRATLARFHQRRLEMVANDNGAHRPVDAPQRDAPAEE